MLALFLFTAVYFRDSHACYFSLRIAFSLEWGTFILRYLCALAGLAAYELLSDPVRASQLDVVFMDILMPGLSGIEVLERLGANRPTCPIIATTGSVEASSVDQFRCVFIDCMLWSNRYACFHLPRVNRRVG